jgi:hypothetical protein
MELRDRFLNYAFLALAILAWSMVVRLVTTTYPRQDPTAALFGAGLMGLACGLTAVPIFWLLGYARHRRIAHRGDWGRAMRRAAWVGLVVALFVALRVQGVFSLPIGIFVLVMVLLAEVTLSIER